MDQVEDHFFGKKNSDDWSEDEYVKHCYEVEKRIHAYFERRAEEIFNPKAKGKEAESKGEGEGKKKKSKNQRKKEKREE